MNRQELMSILDIDSPEEFEYFENIEALMEYENHIDEEVLGAFIEETDTETFSELTGFYFNELLDRIPDDQTDLYITADNISRIMKDISDNDSGGDRAYDFAAEIIRFRKWYILDRSVKDKKTDEDVSICDALYGIAAAKLLGETCEYDFSNACDYERDGYDINIHDLVMKEDFDNAYDIDDEEI